MKKVINGRLYNKDTSDHICDTGNDLFYGISKYERSDLYRTRGGAYFLYGRGGDSSRFAIVLPDGARTECSSNTIIAISEAEARRLVELHGDYEDYHRCFGEPGDA